MNEMRYDWLSDRWVIFAPNRMTRPDDYVRIPVAELHDHGRCPFCSGAEHETPDATLVLPERHSDDVTSTRPSDLLQLERRDWQVRVVPNKYPAVTCTTLPMAVMEVATIGDSIASGCSVGHPPRDRDAIDQPAHRAHRESSSQAHLARDPRRASRVAKSGLDLFVKRETHGAHEVIIESPQHVSSITGLSRDHAALVFEAYHRRLVHWRARATLKYAVVFKNYGADAGASLIHSHSQLIGTDFVPSDIARMQHRLTTYTHSYERCYLCDVLAEELQHRERIVDESEHFVALCPFASRFPYTVQILPRRHRSTYEACPPQEISDLAFVVQRVLRAIELEHPTAAYNYILHTAPFEAIHPAATHWRVTIIPRLCKVAGFEWSSDCFINTVLPEHAARTLRSRLV
jgi:UDPglucose--hexose-1-phosphate uridylyltransferase